MELDLNTIRLWFVDAGTSGKAGAVSLLFVHGFPLSHQIWAPQIQALSTTHRIIAPELRGHGKTEATPGPYKMENFADDLKALIEARRCGPVMMIGHSMGGYVTFAFLRRYPKLVAGLGLICTRPGADTPEAKTNRENLAQRVEKEGSVAVVDAMFPKMLAPSTYTEQPELSDNIRRMMLATPVVGIAAALRGMALRTDSSDLLPTIKVPTLIIAGADDQLISPKESENMAKQIPGATPHVVPGAGHLPSMEKPEEFNRVLREFLTKNFA
jgi:pimeloyl-ACP methyl ester carboxylesterase